MFSVANLGAGITSAILPLYIVGMGLSVGQLGLLLSTIHSSSATLRIPIGYLSDRHGYRRFYLAGLILAALALLSAGFASDWSYLVVAVVLAGLSHALYYVMQNATMIRDVPSSRRGVAFAWLFFSMHLGGLIGPAIGGIVAESFGLRPPFLLSSAIIITALSLAVVVLGTRDPTQEKTETTHSMITLLRMHKDLVLRICTARMLYHLPFTVFTPLVVLLLRGGFSATYFEIGLATTVSGIGGVVGSLVSERLGRAVGKRLVIVCGLLVASPAALATAFAATLVAAVAALAAVSFIWGTLTPNYDSLIGDLSPQTSVALIYSTATTFGRVGMPLSSILGGAVAEYFGIRSSFIFIAATCVVAGVMQFYIPKGTGRVSCSKPGISN